MSRSPRMLPLVALLVCLAVAVAGYKCPASCRLPKCYCDPGNIPGGFKRDQTPQLIAFTYADAIDVTTLKVVRQLFTKKQLNPNECPAAMTFFVTDNGTDYCGVHRLYVEGHEVAVYSITRRTPSDWWRVHASYDDWLYEFAGERQKIVKHALVPEGDVLGVRAPYLTPGGDTQFDMMARNQFLYDNTLLAIGQDAPMWPLTLDLPWKNFVPNCANPTCPTSAYEGLQLWEVPINMWTDRQGRACSFLDSCIVGIETNKNAILKMIWKNFNRHYDTNRAPLLINLRMSALINSYVMEALRDFLAQLRTRQEVYVVTVQDAIKWVRQPTPLSGMKGFKGWSCAPRKYNPACKLGAGIGTGAPGAPRRVYFLGLLGLTGTDLVIMQYVVLFVATVLLIRKERHERQMDMEEEAAEAAAAKAIAARE